MTPFHLATALAALGGVFAVVAAWLPTSSSGTSTEAAELVTVYDLAPDLAQGIADTARAIGVPARWLADLISFESAGFDAQAVNPISGASGLIQFMPATARELGTTVEAIRQLSAVEQLPLVQRYFELPRIKQYGALGSRLDLYMAVFYPRAIGQGAAYTFPASVQASNPGIATAGDYRDYVNRRAERYAK